MPAYQLDNGRWYASFYYRTPLGELKKIKELQAPLVSLIHVLSFLLMRIHELDARI